MNNAFGDQKVGNWRIKRTFLIYPMELNGVRRWLKFVKIKQVLSVKTTTLYNLNGDPYTVSKLKWMNEEFVNE